MKKQKSNKKKKGFAVVVSKYFPLNDIIKNSTKIKMIKLRLKRFGKKKKQVSGLLHAIVLLEEMVDLYKN